MRIFGFFWTYIAIVRNVKSFPSCKAHRAALISVPLTFSQIPVYTARLYGHRASASCGLPVYVSAFTETHCAYPRRDGQAELTWIYNYTFQFKLPFLVYCQSLRWPASPSLCISACLLDSRSTKLSVLVFDTWNVVDIFHAQKQIKRWYFVACLQTLADGTVCLL